MLAKKKKYEQKMRNAQKPAFYFKGLFAPKASKEHLLEQLKKGTLFHSAYRSSPDPPSQVSNNYNEECWLNQIKLFQETETIPAQQEKTKDISQFKSSKKHLPMIKDLKEKKNPKVITSQTRRYNRLECVEKKLNKTGAWNKQNQNGIDSNLSKLAVTLNYSPSQLTYNDFRRVKGLTYQDRSIDQSILSMSSDMMSLSRNPFSNLSFVECGIDPTRNRGEVKLWQSLRRRKKLAESQGHFIPAFLMSSLVVEKTSDLKK